MSNPSSAAGIGATNGFSANGNQPVEYRRVYVWELPVRAYHWINAIALVTLCVTGFLIGHPFRLFYAQEAYQQYWFAWVRFFHFAAAFVYVFNFLARLYWGFAGNQYARWTAFFPFKRSQQQEIVDVIKADVLETKMHGPISTGHNALAGLIYFGTFLVFVFQTITGFALYSSTVSYTHLDVYKRQAWKRYSSAAILATPGPSPSASAASALPCMRSPACVPLKMHSASLYLQLQS